jgi:hypothetical protein
MIKKIRFSLIIALVFASCNPKTQQPEPQQPQNTKQALLIGTFHYHNPGADVAQTKSFAILNESAQAELEQISEKIKAYQPDQVFVEWPYDEQQELDSLYQLYLNDTYFTNDSLSDFYVKNEIFQLAFRVAKKVGLKSVQAVDYQHTDFPFDSLMTVIESSKQDHLQSQIEETITYFTEGFNSKIKQGSTLMDLTYYLNSEELRKRSNEFHTQVPLKAGGKDNFVGAHLTAEWYRRNLFMWSLVEKSISNKDERIMLLLGASHIAMIKDLIDNNPNWSTVELQEVMGQ